MPAPAAPRPRRNLAFVYVGLSRDDVHALDLLAEQAGVTRSHLCAEQLRRFIDASKGRTPRVTRSRYSWRFTNPPGTVR